jgi:hypothetical protein
LRNRVPPRGSSGETEPPTPPPPYLPAAARSFAVARSSKRRCSSRGGWTPRRWSRTSLPILAIVLAARVAQCLVWGTRCGSSPHLRVVRVVVSAEISGLLLGADGRWRGGLPIFLIKDVVLGFFLRQNNICLMSTLISR